MRLVVLGGGGKGVGEEELCQFTLAVGDEVWLEMGVSIHVFNIMGYRERED